jgi:ribosomal protein S18 acetylase RimI-like enzyme
VELQSNDNAPTRQHGGRFPAAASSIQELTMNIRKAVPDDALGIAKAHVDSWRSAYRGLVPDDRLAGMDCSRRAGRFRESITQEEELIYVAEDAIGIAGFLALGPCRDPGIDSTATAEVYALYLAPGALAEGDGPYDES